MDIEFIQEKHRDNIFKLMELCGIDMAEAYELYTNAGNSFEKAMQMHFNEAPQVQPSNDFEEYKEEPKHYQNNGQLDEFDSLYQKYRAYRQTGNSFEKRYQIRKDAGFFGSLIPKFLKGSPESNFKKSVENYIGKSCLVQFAAGSLSSTLAQSDKFPVIVYILDFSPAMKAKTEQILRNNQFVDMVNVQFKNFGIDPQYQIEKSIEKFVDRKKNNNCLVILRVNAVQEIQVMKTIPLNNAVTKQVLQKLKLTKNLCISKDLDDSHLEKRLQEQLMGNFDYQKPVSIAQRRKIAQDRQIRKKQEEEFYASMKVEEEKTRKNSAKNQNEMGYQETPVVQPSSKPAQNNPYREAPKVQTKPAPKRDLTAERKQIRDKLKNYTEGMNIRLRLPSGEAVIVVVDPSQKAKYLFDYVQGMDKDIGFERDAERNFNIIRPYDKLNLGENLTRSLKQVFEGSDSENLVVIEV